MARFDFVEASASGYRFLMHHHADIGRIAMVPLSIKLTSFLIITALDLDENYLRQGLLLIPSYFAEGWLVAQLIRLAIYKEQWPVVLSGDQKKDLQKLSVRFRSIMSATIVYVLIKLALAVISGLVMHGEVMHGAERPEAMEPTSGAFLFAMIFVLFVVWAFRFIWLYVPVALDLPMKMFLKRIRAYQTSIYMMGTWLLCFVPLAIIFIMISEFFLNIFPPLENGDNSEIYKYAMVSFQAVLELMITIVSSIGMAHGIHSLFVKKGESR
ncbi:MAG: hypothetical protein AAF244_05495 [Pseudomonadota bacterium]